MIAKGPTDPAIAYLRFHLTNRLLKVRRAKRFCEQAKRIHHVQTLPRFCIVRRHLNCSLSRQLAQTHCTIAI